MVNSYPRRAVQYFKLNIQYFRLQIPKIKTYGKWSFIKEKIRTFNRNFVINQKSLGSQRPRWDARTTTKGMMPKISYHSKIPGNQRPR